MVSNGPGHFGNKHPHYSAYMIILWALSPPMGDLRTGNHLFKDLNKWKPVEIREALGKS